MAGKLVYMSRNLETAEEVFEEFARVCFTEPPRKPGAMIRELFTLIGGKRKYNVEWDIAGYWSVRIAEE